MLIDYHVHGLNHGERKHLLAEIEPFVKTALKKGIGELGFTEHDWLFEEIDFSLYEQLRQLYPGLKIRIGLELEYREGKEAEFAGMAMAFPFDYIIGSVHEINDWPFDHPDHITGYDCWESDKLYQKYFDLVRQMARTKLSQVVGHLDLIKVFGFRPRKKITEFLPPVLTAIKEAGMAVEINTNGWYKPVQEAYPAAAVLAECFRFNIPVTTGSDAHHFDQVGRDLEQAVLLAKKAGYNKVAGFVQKKITLHSI